MILAIDIGNTTASFGCLKKNGDDYDVRCRRELATKMCENEADAAAFLTAYLADPALTDLTGAVLCSVVPAAGAVISDVLRSLCHTEIFVVTRDCAVPLDFEGMDMTTLGHDRIADAAWAAVHMPLPVMTVDLGTATTFNIVDKNGTFRGGLIAAGVGTGLKALHDRTAALPLPALARPEALINNNTRGCLLAGAVIGTAAMIDGIAQRAAAELDRFLSVVITGGYADEVSDYMLYPHLYEKDLLMKGLGLLYDLNRRPENR